MKHTAFIEREKEWKGLAVLAASEIPMNANKATVARELYARAAKALKELVANAVNETSAFGGYASYTTKMTVKLMTLRDDFISRADLARMALAHRDSIVGNREPSSEELALWEAADKVLRAKTVVPS